MGLGEVLLLRGARLVWTWLVPLEVDIALRLPEHRFGLHLRLDFVGQISVQDDWGSCRG